MLTSSWGRPWRRRPDQSRKKVDVVADDTDSSATIDAGAHGEAMAQTKNDRGRRREPWKTV
jgi:hypothetical protein